jgi:ABC-type multidrug transport system ATPase subunit
LLSRSGVRDRGEVSVLGVDPGAQRARLKSRIGIVLQSTSVDRYLTVRETIAMSATFYPRPRPVDEVISLVGLQEKRDPVTLQNLDCGGLARTVRTEQREYLALADRQVDARIACVPW